ncbi:MAG: hypothetical protein WCR95_06490 [Eubacteriales bacterium]
MKIKNILIAAFGDTGNEPEAIRQALEAFNYFVTIKYIGRPNDFIDVLNNKLPFCFDCIVLSCHSENGNIIMPVLSNEIYAEGEPKNNFSHKEINSYNNLHEKLIINLGCATGYKEMIAAFAKTDNTYIAPGDYIEGNSALFFTIKFFYEMAHNKKSIYDAFILSQETDQETELFILKLNS